jgi:hypothetical protein
LRYVGPQTPFTGHIPRLATRSPFSSFNPQTEFSHFLLAGVVRRIVVTPPIVILEKKKKTLLRGNKQTVVVRKACAECGIHQTTKNEEFSIGRECLQQQHHYHHCIENLFCLQS